MSDSPLVSDALYRQPLTSLKGVGPAVAEKLAKLKLLSVQDVLFHLPLRYQDRTHVHAIGGLQTGQECVIQAEVTLANVVFRKRRSLLVTVHDGSGQLTLRFFYFSQALEKQLQRGAQIRCFGEVRRGPSSLEMVHPECHVLSPTDPLLTPNTAHPSDSPHEPDTNATLTPVYPTTEGLSQISWRKITDNALVLLRQGHALEELLPKSLTPSGLPSLAHSLLTLHRPPPEVNLDALKGGTHPAIQRLAFEELLAYQLTMQSLRKNAQQYHAPRLKKRPKLASGLQASLPFALTQAQQRVLAEIEQDLALSVPMLRLIQGDVGSGKTVVAALAACNAVAAGYQVAIMAPTDLLAEQHYRQFDAWFAPLEVNVGWLSGKLTSRAKRIQQERAEMGVSQIIVGTHALFQKDTHYHQLGLVIIDEQHRFGVDQRLALVEKGRQGERVPHQMTMTATPIPRTLAMTAYADFDCSIIDELPPGRTPVETAAVDLKRKPQLVQRLHAAVQSGRQAYWVCTLIEESEMVHAQAAEDTAAELREALPDCRIGLVHSRLAANEKDAVMQAFAAAELDILVATTVIEVGVNVPNASLMVIENAERLGLSQLHQLRGRVGRGSVVSHCVLLVKYPLAPHSQARINVMRQTNDGFLIAEKDLEIRGAGELLGTRQTGDLAFKVAELQRDQALLEAVKDTALSLLSSEPERAKALIDRWQGHDVDRYGSV